MASVFMKLTTAERHHVNIQTELHQTGSRTMEIARTNVFTALRKAGLSLSPFSRNYSHVLEAFCKQPLHHIL